MPLKIIAVPDIMVVVLNVRWQKNLPRDIIAPCHPGYSGKDALVFAGGGGEAEMVMQGADGVSQVFFPD